MIHCKILLQTLLIVLFVIVFLVMATVASAAIGILIPLGIIGFLAYVIVKDHHASR